MGHGLGIRKIVQKIFAAIFPKPTKVDPYGSFLIKLYVLKCSRAEVAELADAHDSKSCEVSS